MKDQRAIVRLNGSGGKRAEAGPYVLRSGVFQLDPAFALIRHDPETRHVSAGLDLPPPAAVRVQADARAEEVTRRTPHSCFAIERNGQDRRSKRLSEVVGFEPKHERSHSAGTSK